MWCCTILSQILRLICNKEEERKCQRKKRITVVEVISVIFPHGVAPARNRNSWDDMAVALGVRRLCGQPKPAFDPITDLQMLLQTWISYRGHTATVSELRRAMYSVGLGQESFRLDQVDGESIVTFCPNYETPSAAVMAFPPGEQPSADITIGNIQENPYLADKSVVTQMIEYYAGRHLKVLETARESWICEVTGQRPRDIRVTLVQNLNHFSQPLNIAHLATELVANMQGDRQFCNSGFTVDVWNEIV